MTYLHESCYTWLLAVAVIKERQLPVFHLPHKIARLHTNSTTLKKNIIFTRQVRKRFCADFKVSVLWLYLIIADTVPTPSLIRQSLQILDPELQNEPDALDDCSPLTVKQQTVLVRATLLRTFTSIPFSRRLSGSDFISQWLYCGGPSDSVPSLVAFFLPPAASSFAEETVSPSAALPELLKQRSPLVTMQHNRREFPPVI